MIYSKMTHGWVAQQYDSETGDCVSQEFIPDADAVAQRVYQDGQAVPESEVEELQNTEKPCSMDMVQP